MVKIGIIVEGDCEKIVLETIHFSTFLSDSGLELVDEIINIGGKSKLKPDAEEMQNSINILRDQGAAWIIVLRDMDDAPSFKVVKDEVLQQDGVMICIAVKELEAWFLADSKTMSALFKTEFYFEKPEEPLNPPETISKLSLQFTGRGTAWERTGGKINFANKIVRQGFTIQQAAEHPNCPSARYFLTTLQTIASAN